MRQGAQAPFFFDAKKSNILDEVPAPSNYLHGKLSFDVQNKPIC